MFAGTGAMLDDLRYTIGTYEQKSKARDCEAAHIDAMHKERIRRMEPLANHRRQAYAKTDRNTMINTGTGEFSKEKHLVLSVKEEPFFVHLRVNGDMPTNQEIADVIQAFKNIKGIEMINIEEF